MSCPARLEKAGVKVAFNTDDPITNSRMLLRSAALAVRGGMSEDAALKGLTIYPAEMLDLQGRVGSLEVGKDADFIVLSGAPLSVYTHVLQTWIEVRRIDSLASTGKIDRLTSRPSEQLDLSIDDFEDRAAMLQDVRARISFLKRDLGMLIASLQSLDEARE